MALLSISSGNSKLPGIPNVSGVPGRDCRNCSSCLSVCYAQKAYKAWPSVTKAWDDNSELLRSNPARYFSEVCDYLDKHKPRWFRIHVAGDFISPEHVDQWILVALEYPDTRFLAFTKSFDCLPSQACFPPNLQIVLSIFPDMALPKHKGYAIAFAGEASEYTDPRAERALECPGLCSTCGACWSLSQKGIDVRFSLH